MSRRPPQQEPGLSLRDVSVQERGVETRACVVSEAEGSSQCFSLCFLLMGMGLRTGHIKVPAWLPRLSIPEFSLNLVCRLLAFTLQSYLHLLLSLGL